jgi:hypothetical protein
MVLGSSTKGGNFESNNEVKDILDKKPTFVWDDFSHSCQNEIASRTAAAIEIGGILYKVFRKYLPLNGEERDNFSFVTNGIEVYDPFLMEVLNRNFYFGVNNSPLFKDVLKENKGKLGDLLTGKFNVDPYCQLSLNVILLLATLNKSKRHSVAIRQFRNIGNAVDILSLALIPGFPEIKKHLTTFIRKTLTRMAKAELKKMRQMGSNYIPPFFADSNKQAHKLSTIINNTDDNELVPLILQNEFIRVLFRTDKRRNEFFSLIEPEILLFYYTKVFKVTNLYLGQISIIRSFRNNVTISTAENNLELVSGKGTFFTNIQYENIQIPHKEQTVFTRSLPMHPFDFILFVIPNDTEILTKENKDVRDKLNIVRELFIIRDPIVFYCCLYHNIGLVKTGRAKTLYRSNPGKQPAQRASTINR